MEYHLVLAGREGFLYFSLLFGFSFFIQLDNAARRGMPFRGRFVWRMFLLLLFSQLHSLFYNGDILLLYSVMGAFVSGSLSFVHPRVLTVAVIMILQPLEWIRLLCTLLDIPFLNYGNHWLTYAKLAKPVMESGNVWEVIVSNITYGQLYGNLWQIENGRIFQIGGLFLFGMVAGREQLFRNTPASIRRWKWLVLWAAVLFVPFHIVRSTYPAWVEGCPRLAMPLDIALPSISNFLLMVVLVGLFTLIGTIEERVSSFSVCSFPMAG